MTSLNRRHFSVLAGSAALASMGLPRAQAADAPLVLGQSAPFTGPAAQLGIQFHQGAKLYLDQYNAQSGQRPVTIRQLDDGYDPERTAANTRQLIQEQVFALFGYIGTPTSLAALPLAAAESIPFIAPFSGAMSLREPFQRNVFHVRASYNDETAQIVRHLTTIGNNKIAVFYQNDAYGKAGLDGVTQALAQHKLKPVATGVVERNSVDVDVAVRAIVAAQPHAVVQVSTYKSCAAFIRAARKAGFSGTFYNVSFVGAEALANELGKEGAGVVVSQVVPSPTSGSSALAREYQEAMRKGGGAAGTYASIEGYLAAKVFVEGLKRARAPTRDGLIAGLETLDRQSFGGFDVTFTPRSHMGSKFVEMSMLTADKRIIG
ncbi:ABC-type branched-subunit amino acid transport system substrate-binding protein [Comamonas odontotermitis]|uniref:ABC-type branched-subunit amino acid transport system substrate-binding protein n=1 Tax=Comamonas odontotermitis TaxID=379895 RepID=A0ABR6RC34_9BURK|nr:ABC transporter substrate-binding protein [Comamonas odontotermitis]MBB6576701.1 ABC-type branched-subunit amino acid transport system substrate-binding protein [Comamonas odontotermitis]